MVRNLNNYLDHYSYCLDENADHVLENYGNDSSFNEQMLESYFSDKIESQFKISLSKIIATCTVSKKTFNMKSIFLRGEKIVLANHIALQLTRTKEFRETILEAEEKVMKHSPLLRQNISFLMSVKKIEVVREKEFESITHASHMFNIGESAAFALSNHVWFIGVNESKVPLYNSDHPVVQFSHAPQNEPLASGGIASFGTEIAFPINEKLILLMYEREYWKKIGNKQENLFSLSERNVEFSTSNPIQFSNIFFHFGFFDNRRNFKILS